MARRAASAYNAGMSAQPPKTKAGRKAPKPTKGVSPAPVPPAPVEPPRGAVPEPAPTEIALPPIEAPHPHAATHPAHAPAVPREPSARALRYREHRIPRRHRVFVNRNLRMTDIRAIGFDLDHTLAHYDPIPVEELAFDLTKRKLVENKGYPREVLQFQYDPQWVIRGLVVDKKRGNIFKMD